MTVAPSVGMANAKMEIGRLTRSTRAVSVERPPAERCVVTDIPVLRAMVASDMPASDETVMTIEAEFEQ
jgi:hypothetical protein